MSLLQRFYDLRGKPEQVTTLPERGEHVGPKQRSDEGLVELARDLGLDYHDGAHLRDRSLDESWRRS